MEKLTEDHQLRSLKCLGVELAGLAGFMAGVRDGYKSQGIELPDWFHGISRHVDTVVSEFDTLESELDA